MTATARSGAAALPVRPGEKPWTPKELAGVRQELQDEASGLRRDLSAAESEIADPLRLAEIHDRLVRIGAELAPDQAPPVPPAR